MGIYPMTELKELADLNQFIALFAIMALAAKFLLIRMCIVRSLNENNGTKG
jgi:hypothetical protein